MEKRTRYEAMIIVPAKLEEERVNALMERFQKVLTDQGATIQSAKPWDKRRMAYEINNTQEGIYLLIQFESAAGAPDELNRVLHLTEEVVRARIFRQEPQESSKNVPA